MLFSNFFLLYSFHSLVCLYVLDNLSHLFSPAFRSFFKMHGPALVIFRLLPKIWFFPKFQISFLFQKFFQKCSFGILRNVLRELSEISIFLSKSTFSISGFLPGTSRAWKFVFFRTFFSLENSKNASFWACRKMSAKAVSELTGKELLYKFLQPTGLIEAPVAVRLNEHDDFNAITAKSEWISAGQVRKCRGQHRAENVFIFSCRNVCVALEEIINILGWKWGFLSQKYRFFENRKLAS